MPEWCYALLCCFNGLGKCATKNITVVHFDCPNMSHSVKPESHGYFPTVVCLGQGEDSARLSPSYEIHFWES